MKLKLTRSQRQGGVISTNTIFCLDARVELTAEELSSVNKYKMGSQVLYNSEAAKRNLDKANAVADGSFAGSFKQIGYAALAAMRLNITINGLQRGQHIECKDLDEVIAAEEALMRACENLKGYLLTANSFDGREVLYDFSGGDPELIAPRADATFVPPAPSPAPAIGTTYAESSPAPASTPPPAPPEFYEPSTPAFSRSSPAAPDDDTVERVKEWWNSLATFQRGFVIAGAILAFFILRAML